MILMPQIFDVIANENARYKRNELEWEFTVLKHAKHKVFYVLISYNQVHLVPKYSSTLWDRGI